MPFEQILDQMEAFWDSEAPRIGEPGANGWASWAAPQSTNSTAPSEPSRESAAVKAQTVSPSAAETEDGYQKWSAVESRLDVFEWLPTRDDTEDPYSTIMFSDIRPLLFPPSSSYPDLSTLLVALETLGLHVPGLSAFLTRHASPSHAIGDEDVDSAWSYTPFMSKSNLLESIFAIPSSKPIINAQSHRTSVSVNTFDELFIGKERHMGNGWGPVKEWHLDSRPLLEGYGLQCEGRMWEETDIEGVDAPFIRLGLSLLTWSCIHNHTSI